MEPGSHPVGSARDDEFIAENYNTGKT